MRRARTPFRVLTALLIVAVPGCLMGSPLAAISGEPYGMVIDDVQAIRGKNNRIWSGAPVAAVFDIPLAFVLDTAFLPISVLIWAIKAVTGSGKQESISRRDREERRNRRRRASDDEPADDPDGTNQ